MSQSAPSSLPSQRRSTRILTILGLVLIAQLFMLITTLIKGPGRIYLAGAVALLALAGFLAIRARIYHLLTRTTRQAEAAHATGKLTAHTPHWLRSLNITLLTLAIVLQAFWFSYSFRPCGWLDLIRRMDGCTTAFRHVDTVSTIAVSPDQHYLSSRSLAGNVSLWQIADGQRLRRRAEGIVVGHTLAFSPDGKLLATGQLDGTVQLSDVRSGVLIRTIGAAAKPISGVVFSPDGSLLAAGAWDQSVRIWRVRDGALLQVFTGLGDGVHNVAFSPDSALLAAGDNRAIWLWNVADGALHARIETESLTQNVAFSPDGTLLAAGGWRGGVGLWRVEDGSLVRRLDTVSGQINGVAFSPDGTRLAAAGQAQVGGGEIKIWRLTDGANVQTIDPRGPIQAIAWLPDEAQIAVATSRHVELWNIR